MSLKLRLIIVNFLQFAVWGACLTSIGTYLVNANLASDIDMFYAIQGIVFMFMPMLVGIDANYANALIPLSQVSETLCILLMPFFFCKFELKRVMLIAAMFAWVFRFGLFGAGNPGNEAWMFILSMIIYGIVLDLFNISGSLFVDQKTIQSIHSSAQELFMIMTNGIGAIVGTLGAQVVVRHFTYSTESDGNFYTVGDWHSVWYVFAAYAFVVGLLFAWIFKF